MCAMRRIVGTAALSSRACIPECTAALCSDYRDSLCSAASATPHPTLYMPMRGMHGKPSQGHKVRTQHSRRWWMQSKARHLTAIPHEEARSRPHFPAYNEDVDRPMVVPEDACCFNCNKAIESEDSGSFVWVPSGNACVPTKQGYFFHYHCFKCWNCKLRIMHNQFYSKDGKAWCLACAMGRDVRVPTRRWHTSFVNTHRTGSRMSGHFFPRHRHQMEFVFDPDS